MIEQICYKLYLTIFEFLRFMRNFYNPLFSQLKPRFSLRNFLHQRSILNKLLIINVIVYLAMLIARLILNLIDFLLNSNLQEIVIKKIVSLLAFPASLQSFLYRPWSIVTSLFFHIQFGHILFNMLMLWIAGRIFTQYVSEKKLLITYFVGGMVGNLFYLIAYNIFPVFSDISAQSIAFGASGSIMAILAAITIFKPQYPLHFIFLGQIKLKWVMLIFIIIDLISIPKGNAGGHIAHLGGALYGALFMLFSMKKNFIKIPKKKKKKFYTSFDSRPFSDEEFNKRKHEESKKIDAILDKISRSGYDALTDKEKEFLFSQSKK